MSKKKTKDNKEITASIQEVAIPLKWYMPDNMITRFASNMVVQLVEGDCRILFFEAKPDIHLSLQHIVPKEVAAECVANIIINANKLPKFIEVLQKQYDVHTNRNKS